MRKLLLFVALIIPMFVAGVAYAQPSLPGVDESTRAYLGRGFVQQANGGKVFVAYRPYGFERSGNRLYGYLWAYLQEYYVSDDRLLGGPAFSSPLLVIYELQNGSYQAVMHQQPMGGSFYSVSVRNIFPSRFHDDIFGRRGVALLAREVQAQAQAYYDSAPVEYAP